MAETRVSAETSSRLGKAIDELARRYGSAADPEFLRSVRGFGHLLPGDLREHLTRMRYEEEYAGLVIRDCPVDQVVPQTPRHWMDRAPDATSRHDFWLALVTAQLGEPVALWNIQAGRLLTDVLPIVEDEHLDSGYGSAVELELHVEEAFQDERPQAFGLLCLRNDGGVPTTLSCLHESDLRELDVDVLFEARFLVGDDQESMRRPVLFGSPSAPYLRFDGPYTRALPDDARAARALMTLGETLRRNVVDVVLTARDLLLVDNYRVVHGRRPFHARFDGSDRWLRRIWVTRDLRPTRAWRASPDDRTITDYRTALHA